MTDDNPWAVNSDEEEVVFEDEESASQTAAFGAAGSVTGVNVEHALLDNPTASVTGFNSTAMRQRFGSNGQSGSRTNSFDAAVSASASSSAGVSVGGAVGTVNGDLTNAVHTIAELQDKVLVLQANLAAAEAVQRLPATASAAVLAGEIRVTPAAAQEALRRGLKLQRKQYLHLLDQLTSNLDAKEQAQRAKLQALQELNKRTEENAQALCLELGRAKEGFSELQEKYKRLQKEMETSTEMHAVETRSLRQIVATLQAELAASGVTTDAATRNARAAQQRARSFARAQGAPTFPGENSSVSTAIAGAGSTPTKSRQAPPLPPDAGATDSSASVAAGLRSSNVDEKSSDPPASVAVTVRERVLDFYRRHNPAKIGDVDGILEKFAGRERELLVRLHEKYGITVPADVMFTDEADQFVVVVPRDGVKSAQGVHASPLTASGKPPVQKKTSALGKMFGATLGRVFRSSGPSSNPSPNTDPGSSAATVTSTDSANLSGNTGAPSGRERRARSRSGSGGVGGVGPGGSGGGGGGGGFLGFGRANSKLKEEHAAVIEKLQRDVKERDEIHETERDTLKMLVRQMSSEIEILKQKLADVDEDRAVVDRKPDSGPTSSSAAAPDVDVETRWH
eukprot:INCI2258.1.p1 GENE.INCI2258.1~~INCI2258.1.p1  ORF type:complete len:690 (+),score=132.99 INCI2258.1:200-2071(+)